MVTRKRLLAALLLVVLLVDIQARGGPAVVASPSPLAPKRQRLPSFRPWHNRTEEPQSGISPGGDAPPSLRRRIIGLVRPVQAAEKNSQSPDVADSSTVGKHTYNPLRFYMSCMGIVAIWMASGTLFYSYFNNWPLPQSFFYAVDAGMSIGFCTDVYETKLASKAFTIIYILLGASVIGGALALFIQDTMEGIVVPATQEYQVMLERQAFEAADVSRTGVLSFEEFRSLLHSSNLRDISEEDIIQLWSKFDRLKDGVIHFEEFVGTYRGIDDLVKSIHEQNKLNCFQKCLMKTRLFLQKLWHKDNRIYSVFVLWIAAGVIWGMLNQGWDPITATHFAVSALATGGLTGPAVNADGILPARPAIFCGFYCLFGIPLFALTLGHFAKFLVAGQVSALESTALNRPISQAEFDLAKHLTTNDSVVHLSDFIVLQLLRQGKLSTASIEVLKHNFRVLDTDSSGTLTLEQATAGGHQTIASNPGAHTN